MDDRISVTTPPTFAAIMSPRSLATYAKVPSAAIERLEPQLRRLPVTAADRRARCARYDDDRPELRQPPGGLKILVFEKINGFRDAPSVEAANMALRRLADRNGWSLVATDKGGAMNPATLARFDVVVWNNVSGDVLTLSQRAAFRRYIEGGGGYVGLHGSAGDPVAFWDWYLDDLVGARFLGHPMTPQFQAARLVTSGPRTSVLRNVPVSWTITDEWYSFVRNPRRRGVTVVATLDESSYDPGTDLRMGDHPIVWQRTLGKGRSFYSAVGHLPTVYDDLDYMTLLKNGILWAGHAPDAR